MIGASQNNLKGTIALAPLTGSYRRLKIIQKKTLRINPQGYTAAGFVIPHVTFAVGSLQVGRF